MCLLKYHEPINQSLVDSAVKLALTPALSPRRGGIVVRRFGMLDRFGLPVRALSWRLRPTIWRNVLDCADMSAL
jgi:hypothetical protein